MFAGKARAYVSEAPLAYYENSEITTVKRFIGLAFGVRTTFPRIFEEFLFVNFNDFSEFWKK